MVSKKKDTNDEQAKVKLGKLNLNKETVKDLGNADTKKVKGGLRREASAQSCAPTCDGSYTCPS